LTVTKEGIVLGANTVIAKRRNDNGACEIEGREVEILGLISAAFGQPVSPDIIPHLRHADRAYGQGDPVTAQIHIAFTGLPKLEDEKLASFRLFLADQLLQSRLGVEEQLPAHRLTILYPTRCERRAPTTRNTPAGPRAPQAD
jgi:hypothetical protein